MFILHFNFSFFPGSRVLAHFAYLYDMRLKLIANARPCLILFFCFALAAPLCAQSIDSLMVERSSRLTIEKIHVHFDKAVYRPGDTIWYKAYIQVNGRPSELSTTLYTELSDAAGKVSRQNTAPLFAAMAEGSFVLPKEWKDDKFRFRGYTAWMRNGDTSFFYDRQIPVIVKGGTAGETIAKKETSLQFFPEGGDLVAGIETKLAFKANDAYGLPVEVSGTIRDANGQTITDFQSVHNGMGFLWWKPADTSTCYAVWKDVDGKMRRTALPTVQQQGLVMGVTTGENQVFFRLTRSTRTNQVERKLLLVAQMNQALVYRARISMADSLVLTGAVPTAQLPSGILTLTVFDANEQPLAERVVFVNNHEYGLDAAVSIGKKNIAKRGLNEFQISTKDTLRGDFSVAVTDALSDGVNPGSDNIVSRLLLSADVRGRIYRPYEYFTVNPDSSRSLLDLVMLTHGWRRFNWEQLRSRELPPLKYVDGNYISLTATLGGIKERKIRPDETLNAMLQFRDSGKHMLQMPYSGKGQFRQSGLLFYDTVTAGYSFNKDRSLLLRGEPRFVSSLMQGPATVRVGMGDGFLLPSPDAELIRNNLSIAAEQLKHAFTNQKVKVLENVVVKASKSKFQLLDEKYASGVFAFTSSYSYDILSDSFSRSYKNVIDYIQAKLPGIFVIYSTTTGEPHLTWRGKTLDTWLDQMYVTPYDLVSIPISNVAYIKVYNEAESLIFPRRISASVITTVRGGLDSVTQYTISGPQPNLVVYTRHPEDFNAGYNPQDFGKWTIPGYTVPRQFYSPDYSAPNENNALPDLRTTLFWKPDVHLDKTHPSVSLKFYNNDFSQKLRIVIEGMNEEGQLFRYEKVLE